MGHGTGQILYMGYMVHGRYGTDWCAFLLERRVSHGVPRPCGHSCMVTWEIWYMGDMVHGRYDTWEI